MKSKKRENKENGDGYRNGINERRCGRENGDDTRMQSGEESATRVR